MHPITSSHNIIITYRSTFIHICCARKISTCLKYRSHLHPPRLLLRCNIMFTCVTNALVILRPFIVNDISTVKIFPLRLHPARHLVSHITYMYYTSTFLRPQLIRPLPTKMQTAVHDCRAILQESIMFPYYIQLQCTSALFAWWSFNSSLARDNTRIWFVISTCLSVHVVIYSAAAARIPTPSEI